MDKNLFKYIFRYSKRDQIALLCITVFSFPFLYLSLDLPKNIVNDAISGDDSPRLLWGYSFTQLEYLWLLCGTFLALVFVNGGFKYVINIYKGILAERMLRRLRYMLIDRLMRFPMGRFRSVSQGEIVAMTTAETEAVGGFIGDAFALPAFQGGILLTILVFMFVQDPILGIAAIALYPIQAWLIPKLQRKVTLLNKERVRTLRKVSERLGETVAGVADIHANDTARYELADFSNRLNSLFWIRFKAYRLKFFIKFLNNFLAQLTPFFFYSIGGYLVIQGDLSFGALVAILAAYKDLSAPWKELLNYYQRMEDARIKYEQVVEGFTPPDIIPAEVVGRPEEGGVPYGLEQETDPARFAPLEGQLVAANLVLEGDETRAVDNVNFSAPLTSHMALTGPTGGGRSELARLMGRQIFPSGGKITIGARDLASLPETVTGRDIAYVDSESFIRSGSLRDALLYGLKHQPLSAPPETDPKILREAKASGNSLEAIESDWVGLEGTAKGETVLPPRVLEVLERVGLLDDVFDMGLRRTLSLSGDLNAPQCPELEALTARFMEARHEFSQMLEEHELASLVEHFDPDSYLVNASVAENILFGASEDEAFHPDSLGTHPVMRETLEQVGLEDGLVGAGLKTAGLMIDLFRDLPPGHDFFERFAFFDADQMPDFQRIHQIATSEKGITALSREDRDRLLGLSFRLVPAQHRLGILTDTLRDQILEARRVFQQVVTGAANGAMPVWFHSEGEYNCAASVRENILFGKIAINKEGANSQVRDALRDVVDRLELFDAVVALGLESDVGVAGKRLSTVQRQLVVLARGMLKEPKMMIVNEALSSLDGQARARILTQLLEFQKDRGLVWVDGFVEEEESFDAVYSLSKGRLTTLHGEGAQDEDAAAAVEEAAPEEPTPTAPELVEAEAELEGTAQGLGAETRMLANVPFFADLDQSTLKLLAFTGDRKTYSPGSVIMRQGGVGEYAYVIMSGTVDIVLETEEGPRTVAQRKPGDLVGELALLCEAPRTATVEAATEVEALRISAEIFFRLIQDNAQVASTLLKIVSKRLEALMRTASGGKALYDADTGLPNMDMFLGRVRSALEAGAKERGETPSIGVVRIGLTDLDGVLAKIGEGAEKRLFKKVIRRIRGAMSDSDLLARLDRDLFAVLVQSDRAEALVEATQEAFSTPLRFGREALDLSDGVKVEVVAPDQVETRLG